MKGERGRGPGLVISTQDGEKHNRASPPKRINRLPNIKALMSNRSSLSGSSDDLNTRLDCQITHGHVPSDHERLNSRNGTTLNTVEGPRYDCFYLTLSLPLSSLFSVQYSAER